MHRLPYKSIGWRQTITSRLRGRSRRANPVLAPPLKLAMEFGPLGGRKNIESSVNFPKFKVFEPPIDGGPTVEKRYT